MQNSAALKKHSSLVPGPGNPVSWYFRNRVITPFGNELIFLLKTSFGVVFLPVSVAKPLQNQVSLTAGSSLIIPNVATG